MKNRVIAISGKARSGKDTVGDYIKSLNLYSVGYSFANPLKDAVSSLFDLSRESLDGDDRETILPQWGLSIRQILQRFGTESMRDVFGDDFWVKKAQSAIDDKSAITSPFRTTFVISDVRFENEADFCRKNGILIHVTRPDADGDVGDVGHASEDGVEKKAGDHFIINNGSLEDLYAKIDKILK